MKLEIILEKAKDGRDYVQILSDDYKTVNIILIADLITIKDTRSGK